MRCLSIRQPYAYAIIMGFKPVENRDWPTRVRGQVLIHAGKREEAEDVDGVLRMIAHQAGLALDVIKLDYQAHRHLGAIVGAATITDCVTHMENDWFYGPYGFVMSDPRWGGPVTFRGALGFFDVPADIVPALHVSPYLNIGKPGGAA